VLRGEKVFIPMKYSEIRRLVKLVEESEISELEIEEENSRVRILKRLSGDGVAPVLQTAAQTVIPAPLPVPTTAPPISPPVHQMNVTEVVSPMVGTFYSAPSPEAPPYVEVGDRVKPGQVLCIIEAMKLMNEIEAEVSGTIKEIALENAQPVEFGQLLFKIEQD